MIHARSTDAGSHVDGVAAGTHSGPALGRAIRRLGPSFAVAAWLVVVALFSPAGACAAEADGKHDHPVIFGLTTTQLAIAAAVGAGLGATAAITARRMSVGAGLGLLATVYIAHLGVEALIIGGVYFLWPEGPPSGEPEGAAVPIGGGATRISGLGLATSTRQATP